MAISQRNWPLAAELTEDALLLTPESTEARRLYQLAQRRINRSRRSIERREVTVLFADLEGSTPMSGQLDPESYFQVIRSFLRICHYSIERCGGRVHDERGDGVVAVFDRLLAMGDDARTAVAAGLSIVDELRHGSVSLKGESCEDLAVRVGVHSGAVVVDEEGHLYGSTTNIAARIQGNASSNTVLMSAATAGLAGNGLEKRPLGSFDLKGVEEPVSLFQAIQTQPWRSGPAFSIVKRTMQR